MWLTVRQAREQLSNAVSLQTVYGLIHSGAVKATRVRGKILLDAESFDAYLKREGLKLIRPDGTVGAGRRAGPALSEKERLDSR